jgi:G3E family GTPase
MIAINVTNFTDNEEKYKTWKILEIKGYSWTGERKNAVNVISSNQKRKQGSKPPLLLIFL